MYNRDVSKYRTLAASVLAVVGISIGINALKKRSATTMVPIDIVERNVKSQLVIAHGHVALEVDRDKSIATISNLFSAIRQKQLDAVSLFQSGHDFETALRINGDLLKWKSRTGISEIAIYDPHPITNETSRVCFGIQFDGHVVKLDEKPRWPSVTFDSMGILHADHRTGDAN